MHATTDTTASLDRLDITLLADGGVELQQGTIECYDISVTLHRSQLDLLARMTGYLPADEIGRSNERLTDRLHLLAGMIEAHTAPGHPLRAAVAAILPDMPMTPTEHHKPHTRLENAPSSASDSTEPSMDLFADIADGVQNDG